MLNLDIDDSQPKTSYRTMDRATCDNIADEGDGSSGDGRRHGFVCPFVRSDPIRHHACACFKLARVSDVGLHIRRKHPEEAKRMEEAKKMRMDEAKKRRDTGKKKTDKERWYALWDDLFQGQPRPANPYAGTEVVELFRALVMGYIGEQGEKAVSADGRMALMGCLAYVKARSSDMQPAKVSAQGVSNIADRRTHGTNVQGGTHQQPPLLSNPSGPVMGFFQQSDPQLALPGACDTSTFGSTMEPQVLSSFQVNTQPLIAAANWITTHQTLPNTWMDINGYVGPLVAPRHPTSAMNQSCMSGFQYGAPDGSWEFPWAGDDGHGSCNR